MKDSDKGFFIGDADGNPTDSHGWVMKCKPQIKPKYDNPTNPFYGGPCHFSMTYQGEINLKLLDFVMKSNFSFNVRLQRS